MQLMNKSPEEDTAQSQMEAATAQESMGQSAPQLPDKRTESPLPLKKLRKRGVMIAVVAIVVVLALCVVVLGGSYGGGRAGTLALSDTTLLMRSDLQNTISATGRVESASSASVATAQHANVSLTGVNGEYMDVNNVDLLSGRWVRADDINGRRNVCVVSDKLVNNMFGGDMGAALGSEARVDLNGDIQIFRIIGVYEYDASSGFSTASEVGGYFVESPEFISNNTYLKRGNSTDLLM